MRTFSKHSTPTAIHVSAPRGHNEYCRLLRLDMSVHPPETFATAINNFIFCRSMTNMESGMERAGSHSIYIHERKKCCSEAAPIFHTYSLTYWFVLSIFAVYRVNTYYLIGEYCGPVITGSASRSIWRGSRGLVYPEPTTRGPILRGIQQGSQRTNCMRLYNR